MFVGMQRMTMGDMGMVRGFLVIARLVMLGSLAVVLGRMLMMLRGFLMVLVDIVFAVHRALPIGCSEYRRSIIAIGEAIATDTIYNNVRPIIFGRATAVLPAPNLGAICQ
jgi:hypothetical protein